MGCPCCKGSGKSKGRGDDDEGGPTSPHEGGYLMWEDEYDGTLYLKWSKVPVPDCIAFAKVNKRVPDHKFETNLGRVEIVHYTNANATDWYRGIVEYIKAVRAFDGEVKLTSLIEEDPYPTKMFIHISGNEIIGNRVQRIKPDAPCYPLDQIDGVAAIPLDSDALDTRYLTVEEFFDAGKSVGAAMQFDPTGKNPVKVGTV